MMSSDLSPGYQGGRFEGLDEPSNATWFDERLWAPAEWVALVHDDAPLEALDAADPPGPVGFDLASLAGGGGRAGPRAVRVVTARVARVSQDGSGLQLVGEGDVWFNCSRFRPVDLSGVEVGDGVAVEVETARNGRHYLQKLEVLSRSARFGRG